VEGTLESDASGFDGENSETEEAKVDSEGLDWDWGGWKVVGRAKGKARWVKVRPEEASRDLSDSSKKEQKRCRDELTFHISHLLVTSGSSFRHHVRARVEVDDDVRSARGMEESVGRAVVGDS